MTYFVVIKRTLEASKSSVSESESGLSSWTSSDLWSFISFDKSFQQLPVCRDGLETFGALHGVKGSQRKKPRRRGASSAQSETLGDTCSLATVRAIACGQRNGNENSLA